MAIKSFSDPFFNDIQNVQKLRFGIIVSDWNKDITQKLLDQTIETFIENSIRKENLFLEHVPGSFELIYGAKNMSNKSDLDAIICIGCIIRGQTKHFDFISTAVANGIKDLNIQLDIPVIFGVLTTDTLQQALDRCGGKHSNKGKEFAKSAILMTKFNQ